MTKKLPKRGLPPMHPANFCAKRFCRRWIVPRRRSPSCSAYRVRRSMTSLRKSSQYTNDGRCGSGSCAEMVRICGSICRSATICSGPSSRLERKSTLFPRWKWHESLRQALSTWCFRGGMTAWERFSALVSRFPSETRESRGASRSGRRKDSSDPDAGLRRARPRELPPRAARRIACAWCHASPHDLRHLPP